MKDIDSKKRYDMYVYREKMSRYPKEYRKLDLRFRHKVDRYYEPKDFPDFIVRNYCPNLKEHILDICALIGIGERYTNAYSDICFATGRWDGGTPLKEVAKNHRFSLCSIANIDNIVSNAIYNYMIVKYYGGIYNIPKDKGRLLTLDSIGFESSRCWNPYFNIGIYTVQLFTEDVLCGDTKSKRDIVTKDRMDIITNNWFIKESMKEYKQKGESYYDSK